MTTASTGEGRERELAPTAASEGDIPADTLANRLLLARTHAGYLTVKEAAERCGLNYGSWSNWERGARPRELLDVVRAIADGLHMNYEWLLFGGPLLPARGKPTKRLDTDSCGYHSAPTGPVRITTRPGGVRPKGRTDPQRPIAPAAPGRRANRVNLILQTEARHAA